MEVIPLAEQQIAAGDRAGARRALAALLREEPDNIEAWLLLGSLLLDPLQQVECYRRVLRLNPHHIEARALFNEARRRLPAAPPSPPVKIRPAAESGLPNPFAEGEILDDSPAIESESDPADRLITSLGAAEPDSADLPGAAEPALRAWVMQELTRHTGHNEIIRELCARTGMDWPQAQKFVLRIAQQERHTIARKQAPLLIILSLGVLGGGIGIFIFTYRPEGLLMILGGLMGFLRVWYTLRKAKGE